MGDEPPKLFTNKPKRSQVKQFQNQKAKEFSSPIASSTAPSSSSMASQPPPPPPPPPPTPPKESFARRYKFLWPMLLTVNLAIGAYVFTRTRGKGKEEDDVKDEVVTLVQATETTPVEKPPPSHVVKEPIKLREPIPEDRQRELFKWMLEEKRKVKPQNAEEKKRIDEEKAILKQFIRGKSIPSF